MFKHFLTIRLCQFNSSEEPLQHFTWSSSTFNNQNVDIKNINVEYDETKCWNWFHIRTCAILSGHIRRLTLLFFWFFFKRQVLTFEREDDGWLFLELKLDYFGIRNLAVGEAVYSSNFSAWGHVWRDSLLRAWIQSYDTRKVSGFSFSFTCFLIKIR